MTLISILISLVIEHLTGSLDHWRPLRWLRDLTGALEQRLAGYGFWDGPAGVLLVIALPVVLFGVVLGAVGEFSSVLGFLLGLLILLYSLGPKDLGEQLQEYLNALTMNEDRKAGALARELVRDAFPEADAQGGRRVLESVLILANQRLFGVIFWFVVLGPLGALLFRLAAELRREAAGRSAGFAAAADNLYAILGWVPARLAALGYALSGSLVHALEAWNIRQTVALHENEAVLQEAGLGALQYREGGAEHDDEEAYWVSAVYSLLGRTAFIWLTVLAVATLAGWAS